MENSKTVLMLLTFIVTFVGTVWLLGSYTGDKANEVAKCVKKTGDVELCLETAHIVR